MSFRFRGPLAASGALLIVAAVLGASCGPPAPIGTDTEASSASSGSGGGSASSSANTTHATSSSSGSASGTGGTSASSGSGGSGASGGDRPDSASCTENTQCLSGACTKGQCKPWAKTIGGAGTDGVGPVAVDAQGNIVVAGIFAETTSFGTSLGNEDIFLAKFAPDGTQLWIKTCGSNSADGVTSLAIDSAGDIVMVGFVYGPAFFPQGTAVPNQPNAEGGQQIFVSKFHGDGTPSWTQIFGTSANATDVAVGPNNSIYVVGHFENLQTNTIMFGTNAIVGGKLDNALIFKLSSAGDFVAAYSPPCDGYEYFVGITIDSASNLIVIGSATGETTACSTPLGSGSYSLPETATEDTSPLVLTRFSPALDSISYTGAVYGQFPKAQVQSLGGYHSIIVDDQDDIFFTGRVNGGVDFGCGQSLMTVGGFDGFLVEKRKDASCAWQVAFGGDAYDVGSSLALDKDNGVLVIGTFSSTTFSDGAEIKLTNADTTGTNSVVFVARHDRTTGLPLGAAEWGSLLSDTGASVALSASGDLIIGGQVSGNIDFGTGMPLSVPGGADGFVASLGNPPAALTGSP